jgi:hypothetical protein
MERVRTLATIFIVAVAVKYLWELAQAPLYVGMGTYTTEVLWHCFVASLGDGLLLLLIFALGWVVLRRQNWFEQPGVQGYILMLVAGLAIGISVERTGVQVMGRWAYSVQMPLVPTLEVGIVPVLQMLLLPPVIFRVVTKMSR